MTAEQVESQLSAMFDGELPPAECELLSRRIDRDENLRARWSRYALIGAAMRSEPVATAPRGFAGRVSAALDASEGKPARTASRTTIKRKRTLWNTALAASMVAAVAGGSITMLRHSTPVDGAVLARSAEVPVRTISAVSSGTLAGAAAMGPVAVRPGVGSGNGEPLSYVTPSNRSNSSIGLRTQLADYIVAHSEYSTPLMRRNLLSELMSEDGTDVPAVFANPAEPEHIDAATAASSSRR